MEIIEQIRYFNGELDLLVNNEEPNTWLEDNTTAALTFFQDHLMHCRKPDKEVYDQFKQKLSYRLTAFDYIAKHFDQNLVGCDWRTIIAQELTDDEIRQCDGLAHAFHFTVTHWEDSKFHNDEIWNLTHPQRPIYHILEYCKALFPMSEEAFSCLTTFYTKHINPLLEKAYFQFFKSSSPKIQSAFAAILPLLIKDYLPTVIDSKQMEFPVRFLLDKMSTLSDNANLIIVLNWIAKRSPKFITYKETTDGLTSLDYMIQKDAEYVIKAVGWLLDHGAKIKQVPREIWLQVSDNHMLDYLSLSKVRKSETFLSVYLERYLENDEKMLALLDTSTKAKKLLTAHPERLRHLKELQKARAELDGENATQAKTGCFNFFHRKKPTGPLPENASPPIKPR